MTETIYPVAGPEFARQHAGMRAADIPDLPLLHVDWADAEWTGWDELLRRAGIPHGALPGRRFSTFGVVLQACQDDQGAGRRLAPPGAPPDRRRAGSCPSPTCRIPSPGSYYLSWNANHEPSDAIRTLRDWLMAAAADETD